MSVLEKKQISEKEMKILLKIYAKFDALSFEMQRYNLQESLFYILLARKCFKEALDQNLRLIRSENV